MVSCRYYLSTFPSWLWGFHKSCTASFLNLNWFSLVCRKENYLLFAEVQKRARWTNSSDRMKLLLFKTTFLRPAVTFKKKSVNKSELLLVGKWSENLKALTFLNHFNIWQNFNHWQVIRQNNNFYFWQISQNMT